MILHTVSFMTVLTFVNVCKMVSKTLTEEHKHNHLTIQVCFGLQAFLKQIITGDETCTGSQMTSHWFHHFGLESKCHSMEWTHPGLSVKKKFKNQPSGRKLCSQAAIMEQNLERGAVVNSVQYSEQSEPDTAAYCQQHKPHILPSRLFIIIHTILILLPLTTIFLVHFNKDALRDLLIHIRWRSERSGTWMVCCWLFFLLIVFQLKTVKACRMLV